jgi:hypothetical protein
MRDGDSIKEALVEEIDKYAVCTACLQKCYYAPNKAVCIRVCKSSYC